MVSGADQVICAGNRSEGGRRDPALAGEGFLYHPVLGLSRARGPGGWHLAVEGAVLPAECSQTHRSQRRLHRRNAAVQVVVVRGVRYSRRHLAGWAIGFGGEMTLVAESCSCRLSFDRVGRRRRADCRAGAKAVMIRQPVVQ